MILLRFTPTPPGSALHRSLILLALVSAVLTATAVVGVSHEAAGAAGSNSEARIENLRAESAGSLQNGPGLHAARRPSESLARTMIAQANGDAEGAKGAASRKDLGQDTETTSNSDRPSVPGALVALIFGAFGILVVARRRSR